MHEKRWPHAPLGAIRTDDDDDDDVCEAYCTGPVVQRVDNLYPLDKSASVDSVVCFVNTYSLGSNK